MSGGAASSGAGSSRAQAGVQGTRAAIDWTDFNYPPCLNVVHFNLAELPPVEQQVVRWVHRAFRMLVVSLLVNLLVVIINTGLGESLGEFIVISVLDLITLSVIGAYAMYHAYKGVALNDRSMMNRFLYLWGVVLLFVIIAAFVPAGPFSGWANVPRAQDGEAPGFWVAATIVESLLWSANFGVGGFAMANVGKFRKRGRAGFRARSTAPTKLQETA